MKESRRIRKDLMVMFLTVSISIFLLTGIASAPAWEKASGDDRDLAFFANSIQQTADSNYVSLGYSTLSDNRATSLPVEKGTAELSGGTSTDWLNTVQEGIRKSEYSVTWKEQTYLPDIKAAYQAPNRAHNMRMYFTQEGIRVIPRNSTNPHWIWGLSLKGFGYEGDTQPVPLSKLSVSENRIEYKRGNITEWYVNDERGLEQGFAFQAPPKSGKSPSGPWVVLKMDISGDLNATPNTNAIEFTTGGGVVVLRYGELHAFDATGQELPAKFVLAGKKIDIFVDTSGAVYPITVDPLATSPNWTANGNGTFGFSVGTAGDVNGDGFSDVIVGAVFTGSEGKAYVYYGSASGLSTIPNWTAESNQVEAEFGCSVGTAGDVNGDGYSDVIVGARLFDNGETDEGRAYVYYGSASGLSPTANWTAESDHADANFGYAVGTAGDVNGDGYSDVIVGAPHYTGTDTDESKAYVYYGSASGLSPTANWTAGTTQAGAGFGWSVATAGDVNGDGYNDVIVGAPFYDGGQTDEGKAFVYHGSASGLNPTANWTAESNQPPEYGGAQFGWSVATAGDVNGDGYDDLIVGANNSSYDYYPDPIECPGYYRHFVHGGKAYVYHGSASGLSPNPNWTVGGDTPSAEFGVSVGTAGDVNGDGFSDVIVGAGFRQFSGFFYQGAAYMYHGSASGLSTTFDWRIGGEPYDVLGYSVGTAGDVNGDGYSDVIVGSPDNGSGRAYVYYGCVKDTSTKAAWTAQSDQVGVTFSSTGMAGDVNGDGFSDVIVSAPNYDNGGTLGKVFLYFGSALGLSTSADWTIEGVFSASTAGDVNGDGYDDVILGMNVFYGSASGPSATPDWTLGFDARVSTAGDVNGDGYDDIIVGVSGWNTAFVYYGSPSGLSTAADWTVEGDEGFGSLVGTAGDVNGDGYSDVIVGAGSYNYSTENYDCIAYVYHGSASGLSMTNNWISDIFSARHLSAFSAATAGDVNGDGYSDIIIGAYYWDEWWGQEGRASVYHGSASGLSISANWSVVGPHSVAFGSLVGTAGDVNGDGYSDIIVGAYFYTHLEFREGKVFLYHGSASGLSSSTNWTAEGGREYSYFGWLAGTAGDVNGDGYSDIIVRSNYSHPCLGSTGTAYVYHGSPSGLLFSPVANFTATPTSGDSPLEVTFTDVSTGVVASWAWDFDNDGHTDSTEQNPVWTYTSGGDYTVSLTVVGNGGKDTEVKTNYIHVSGITIGYSPSSFSFTATQGGSNPSNQNLSIWNAGDSMNWSVSDNANWLSLSPTSGTDSGTVTASVNITGLTAGTYNAMITITAPGATNSPVTIPVTLTVNTPLTLLSPNGGELIPSGSTYTIQWGAPPEIVKFDIGYSLDNGLGGTWKLIASGLTSYSYNWTVPSPDGNKNTCRVGVRGYNASGGVVGIDTSDNPFKIEVVKLTVPNGGELLTSGETYQITWQTNGTIRPVQSVQIYGSPNEGQSGTWRLLTTVSGNSGYYDWTVPIVGTPKDKCRLGIRLLDSVSIPIGQDISDGSFTVQPAP